MRREQLLSVALDLASRDHYLLVTQQRLAEAAGVSRALPQHYFKGMRQMRDQLMREAVKQKRLDVIAQGLICRNPAAMAAPLELKRSALAFITSIL